MWISISYEDALKRFPTAVAEALAQLKKSRSKYKKDDPATFEWRISYAIAARNSGSVYDLMANAGKPDPYDSMTPEERVADDVSRTIAGITLRTKGGGYSSERLAEVPEDIRERYRLNHPPAGSARPDHEWADGISDLIVAMDKARGIKLPGFSALLEQAMQYKGFSVLVAGGFEEKEP